MEEAALFSALERSDKEKINHWEQRRVVRGDGRPGRGRGLAEEDDDKYRSRMDSPPDDVVAAMSREVAREREQENICAAGRDNICAAGAACMAPKDADLAASPHHCWGCGLRVHCAIFCGKSLRDILIDKPSLVGRTLPGGRVITEGADNETHCVCFTCIGKMTTSGHVDVAAAGNKENIINGSNTIENCLECDECISNLECIHDQKNKLLDSTLLDANKIGKN
jgi:hypothetical protein